MKVRNWGSTNETNWKTKPITVEQSIVTPLAIVYGNTFVLSSKQVAYKNVYCQKLGFHKFIIILLSRKKKSGNDGINSRILLKHIIYNLHH